MIQLSFVTSNTGKVGSTATALAKHDIEVVRVDPGDMPEIQADTSAEVAMGKVKWAFERFQRPVIVNDTAFHIPALGGWPGPTLKYATQKLGYGPFRCLLESLSPENRIGYLEDTIAYCDARLTEAVPFTRRIYGRLVCEPRGTPAHPSFFMMRLFMPSGWDKTIAEMNVVEAERYRQESSLDEVRHQLGLWLTGHFSANQTT